MFSASIGSESAADFSVVRYRLQTINLSAQYGLRTVLDSATIQCEPGRFYALIGPNGSGKSTLLKCLAGLKTPSSGTVRVIESCETPPNAGFNVGDGSDGSGSDGSGAALFNGSPRILTVPGRGLARILAYLPQLVRWEFDLTVRQLVALGRFPYARLFGILSEEDERIVAESLQSVGLESLANRSLDSLSGGEQQRAQLAACFAQRPQILLLDEPTNHLDWGQIRRLMDLLRQFCRNTSESPGSSELSGLSESPGSPELPESPELQSDFVSTEQRIVVGIFHDLEAVREYCDCVICLKSGRVLAQGEPKSLLTPDFVRSLYWCET